MSATTGDDSGRWVFRDELDVPIYAGTQAEEDLSTLSFVILSILIMLCVITPAAYVLLTTTGN